jgi:hypothetical protein
MHHVTDTIGETVNLIRAGILVGLLEERESEHNEMIRHINIPGG